jgi:hypothetical protein
MNVTSLIQKTEKILRDNSSSILIAVGVSGTITTAYLAAKASYKLAEEVLAHDDEYATGYNYTTKVKIKTYWKLYIPTAISGVLTIGCIVGGARLGTKKTAAAYSLLAVSETAFSEYKEKVVEQIGVKKEQSLRDELAQDRVDKTPAVLIVGSGNVLCFESHTGRYFNSDIETLRKAENTINAKMIREHDASLSDFYYLVGLPYTSYSSSTGWNVDKTMELRFSTVMSEDGRPCISFEYNYVKPL